MDSALHPARAPPLGGRLPARRIPLFNRYMLLDSYNPTYANRLHNRGLHLQRQPRWAMRWIAAHAGVVAVAAIFAAAVFLRVWRLGQLPGLNGDEAWYGIVVQKWLARQSAAWFTPTGNPINLCFLAPLAALQIFFEPSIGLLRSVSAASGLAALAANFWLCRKVFDRHTALISTFLLAICPLAIAYSRFAWDASQTPLAAVLVVYAAVAIAKWGITRGRVAGLVTAILLAVYVHPTNVFLLPLAVACCLPKTEVWQRRLAVVAVTLAVAVTMLPRFVDYTALTIRLLSGRTVYEFISLGPPLAASHFRDVLVAIGIGTLMIGGMATCWMRSQTRRLPSCDLQLGCGLLISWLAFFVVAGTRGVQPHYERYAVWLLVPTALLLARCWGALWRYWPQWRLLLGAGGTIAAMVWLIDFQRAYFVPLLTSGGNSHLAFRTAATDPKQQALELMRQKTPSHLPIRVVSRSWWVRQPLTYLAGDDTRVSISDELDRHHSQRPESEYPLWFAELAGSDEAKLLLQWQEKQQIAGETYLCTDYAGRDVVLLFRPMNCSVESLKIFSSP